MVPIEQISKQKVSKSINNPCTIYDGKRYCGMYTYFQLTDDDVKTIQGEELSNDGADLFDLNKYNGANIDGALSVTKDRVENLCLSIIYTNLGLVNFLVIFLFSFITQKKNSCANLVYLLSTLFPFYRLKLASIYNSKYNFMISLRYATNPHRCYYTFWYSRKSFTYMMNHKRNRFTWWCST